MQPYYNNNQVKNDQYPQQQQMYYQNQQYQGVSQIPLQQDQYQPPYIQQGIPLNYDAPPPQQQQNQYYNDQMYQNPQDMNAKQQQYNYQQDQRSPAQIIVKPTHINDVTKHQTHSHYPTEVECLNCKKIVLTTIQYEVGLGTWTMVLLFLCCFWPLMCVPCCCNSMKDVVHYCPLCGAFCGRKKFLC